ncbi:RCC1 domain-containing protein [Jiangella anatolica]|uniref:RCC1-like domain-containing protein n=1 Tax=Jiangella anatolica TaxID=2670374 RepID=A0A2W2BUA4_9ACTN|nr:hypothetical protein [Jiangella anatolica]PZF83944.1 hypothetical protein C1I92_10830 [Jiangella anatolica]
MIDAEFRTKHLWRVVAALATVLLAAAIPGTASGAEPAAPDVSQVLTTADDHSCGIAEGVVFCWGIDNYGQLGNGPELTGNQPAPTRVDVTALPADTWFTDVNAADRHTCGLTRDGDIYCWGSDSTGALGDGPDRPEVRETPTRVDTSILPAGATFATVTAGEHHTCGLASTGAAYCWGGDGAGPVGNGPELTGLQPTPSPVDTSPLDTATWQSIDAGSIHTCGVTTTGTGYCWGNDSYGQVGNGFDRWDNEESPYPVVMAGLPTGTTWSTIQAGDNHTCGLTSDGDAYCWGRDNRGQLGNGTAYSGNQNHDPLPVDTSALPAGTTWRWISSGDELTCAIDSAGALYCWGSFVGNSWLSPVAIDTSGLPAGTTFRYVDVATSGTHICAESEAGVAYCWGADLFGQLGDDAAFRDLLRPQAPVAYAPCPRPDGSPTVIVGTVDTGVPNRVDDEGCTINDLLADDAPASSAAFLRHVRTLTNHLVDDGLLTVREQGTIVRAALRIA